MSKSIGIATFRFRIFTMLDIQRHKAGQPAQQLRIVIAGTALTVGVKAFMRDCPAKLV